MSRGREAPGRGDLDSDGDIDSVDATRFTDVYHGNKWDPRADMDDDGDVDDYDQTLFTSKKPSWDPTNDPGTEVAQAFSDVDNPYTRQGVPHFALATAASATSGTLLLNEHRLRLTDAVTGRWLSRDPLGYAAGSMNLYEYVFSNPRFWGDPLGLNPWNIDMAIQLIKMVDPSINTSQSCCRNDITFGDTGSVPAITNIFGEITVSDAYDSKHRHPNPRASDDLGAYVENDPIIVGIATTLAHEFYHKHSTPWYEFMPLVPHDRESWLQELQFALALLDTIDCQKHPRACDVIRDAIKDVIKDIGILAGELCTWLYGPPAPGYHYEMDQYGNCQSVPNAPPPAPPPAPDGRPGPFGIGPCGGGFIGKW